MSTGLPGGASGPSGQSGPRLRIGDAEREHAVALLGEHYAAGRITYEEFDERSSRAHAAKTNAELWPLFRDLPALRSAGASNGATRAQVPARSAGNGGRRRSGVRQGALILLLVLASLTLFDVLPLFVALLIGWLVLSRGFGHCSRGHSSGSPRAERGSWS